MYMRKKIRNRLIMAVALVLAFVMWRGLSAATDGKFDCEYKLIYAVCTADTRGTELPSLWEILKAGVRF
jgi:hypothetical protein